MMDKLKGRLDTLLEALARRKFRYQNYKKDPSPDVLILDPNYDGDVLGFNLNYLNSLSKAEKDRLLKDIQTLDNSVVDIGKFKRFVQQLFRKGHYKIPDSKKIRRYKELVRRFPALRKIIRRYKRNAIR